MATRTNTTTGATAVATWSSVTRGDTVQKWADDIAAYEASHDYRDPTGSR
ncbi:hypothetical protein GCM10027055_00990 [Janibacter alkaliphilus]|uniref:Uncharacterized protein n=1 Tax=Janibacter alkaliphilus TaxID=1069963 RepID=A0A852X8R4_9MICO|nr:hypothetical protein [Janibacter alkaliphilus]NYG36714.1 hypothetical protein [Janibacter alkaliphilus]